MRLKTYNKNLQRMFKHNILRLLAICFIVAIGIAIATGVGSSAYQIRDALDISNSLSSTNSLTLRGIADKIELIGGIIPPFFIVISILVTSTTFARLIEEERATIACYKTLGYSKFLIILRYLIFSFAAVIIGCFLGIMLGNFALRPIIFNATVAKYGEVTTPNGVYLTQGIIWSIIIICINVLTAFFVSLKLSRKKPAELLRPKGPKAGKVILLERISFFWKRLSFKFKSTFRNIFRFKGKLLMTIFSVWGSTIMLWVGFGLWASVRGLKNGAVVDATSFTDSVTSIAILITLCGIALAVLVLFNLTNINIAERHREIATLKVLGYKPMEVAGFIYREVIILSTAGILLGLPVGYFFNGFLFSYLEFGSLSDIMWYHWLLVALIVFAAVVFSCFLLYRKISKIKMASSLKTVE